MPNPRKPTRQKEIEGTARKDRANPAEPKYEPAVPPAPEWLCDVARIEWQRVAPLMHGQRLLAEVDMAVLAAYCEMFAEVAELTGLLREGRRYLLEEDGQPRKYPISEERRKAIQRMQSLAGELGLTPATRSKVSAIPAPVETDPLTKLLAKKERRQRHAEQPPN